MEEYTIIDIDYYEKDAILEIGDIQTYFQFNEKPTLYEAILYLGTHATEIVEKE